MPYKSDAQRRFMHAKHPKIAARWDKETGGKVAGYGMSKPAKKGVAKGEPTKGSMKGRFKTGAAPAAYKKAVAKRKPRGK